jgi:alpha-beta hydrolase superfamily lysophospholipase
MNPLRALALILTMTFSAAACAPVVLTPGPTVTDPHIEPDAIIAKDGLRLPLRSWLPAGRPDAVVLAVHGFNDYSHAFEGAGHALAAQGIAVYAYDQRGFGNAPNPGYWAGEAALAEDLSTAARLIAARHPGTPFYLLGESMGGALIILTMTRPDAPPVAGVVLSAPAVWSRSSMGFFERSALLFFSYTTPWLTLNGNGLNIHPSDNDAMLRGLSLDPLVIKDTRVDTMHGLCDLMDAAYAAAASLHVPALVLYGEHDEVVPAEPTYRMMASLPSNPVPQVKAVYANGYHMLLRDLQAKVVLTDIAAWIRHPGQPLPSRADQRAGEVLRGIAPSTNG